MLTTILLATILAIPPKGAPPEPPVGVQLECPCWTEDELDALAAFRTDKCSVGETGGSLSGIAYSGLTQYARTSSTICGYSTEAEYRRGRVMRVNEFESKLCRDSIAAECAERGPTATAPQTIPQMDDGSICVVGGGRIVGLAPGASEELKQRTLDLHQRHAVATECADITP